MGNENEVVYLYLDDIIPNRFQPREIFEDQALKELAISIKEHGVIQPIIVRRIGSKYEIIAGERRYKASTMVGLTKIPAIIKNMDDKESSKVALIENLQRKDLTPIEEARTYQKILDLDTLTQEELAKTMGKSQSAVSNKLRLLTLPEEVQDALLHEEISERHARSLLNVNDSSKQVELLRRIISSRMTVRELDKEIKEFELANTNNSNNINSFNNPNLNHPTIDITPEQPPIIEKKENIERLGGVNSVLSPLSTNKEKTEQSSVITNNPIVENSFITQPLDTNIQQAPKEELIGGGLLPNLNKPIIDEKQLQVEQLIKPSSPLENELKHHSTDTIEILDMDSTDKVSKIIPMKPNLNVAIDQIKALANKLKNQGYNIDINEENNGQYYQVTFRINQ